MSVYERQPAGLRSEGGREGGREGRREGGRHEREAGFVGCTCSQNSERKRKGKYLLKGGRTKESAREIQSDYERDTRSEDG